MLSPSEKMKCLEEAVRIAREEVLEELDSIREGANIDNGFLAITSILNDLLLSAENPDSFDEELVEEEEITSGLFAFSIGDQVEIIDGGCQYENYLEFAELSGYPDAAIKYEPYKPHTPDFSLTYKIVYRSEHSFGDGKILYVIENGDKHYIMGEPGLAKV